MVPFTIEELVGACNSILRTRPSLAIQGRTVRFYVSNGLLPPPSGGPKFARYGIEHLRRLVAIRTWLDSGMSLEQAAERIKLGEHGGDPVTLQRKSSSRSNDSIRTPSPVSPRETGRTVRRISLTPLCTLEIDGDADLKIELEKAIEALQIIKNSV